MEQQQTVTTSILSYEDIAKNQKQIENDFVLIKQAFAEAEKKILTRRAQLIEAIQKEQALESHKLKNIIDVVKTFIVKDEGQNQRQV